MASISTDSRGNRRVQFVAGGKRPAIRLGKSSLKVCREVKAKVEAILEARAARVPLDALVAAWLGDIDAELHAKFVAAALAEPRIGESGLALGPFLDGYIDRQATLKSNTVAHLKRARGNLVDFFGEARRLDTITAGDTDDFRQHLLKTLADNTVRRICGRAKQFFRYAVRKKHLAESPFGDMKGLAVLPVKEREVFVHAETAARVLDACPDVEWRLLFALARWGGLRCPSETLELKWGDVDWERSKICVRSPKTEHHEGKSFRWIPIFFELRPHLEAAYDAAADGAVYVITRYRDRNANLRTQLERIIRRAGLEPWQKPFQNLRSTRETELAERYPIHAVCAWIGNSEAVARKHYLQVTDVHFEKAAQNPAQQASEESGNEQKTKSKTPGISGVCNALPTYTHVQAPPVGLEPTTSRLTAGCSTN